MIFKTLLVAAMVAFAIAQDVTEITTLPSTTTHKPQPTTPTTTTQEPTTTTTQRPTTTTQPPTTTTTTSKPTTTTQMPTTTTQRPTTTTQQTTTTTSRPTTTTQMPTTTTTRRPSTSTTTTERPTTPTTTASPIEECGQKETPLRWDRMIVGGRDVGTGEWPWQASLQYTDGNEQKHSCGAVLIAPQFALTAAHCVVGREVAEDFTVVVGLSNLAEETGEEYEVDELIPHENFESNPFEGFPDDIALIKLSKPLNLDNPNIGLACLPPKEDFVFAGNPNCWISGWGKTFFLDEDIPDQLQEANVPVPTNEDCSFQQLLPILDTHICAGDGYPAACNGDSGGPMSCEVDGVWHVAGLTSFGIATCAGIPSVYTRVSEYLLWIELNMELYSN